MKILSPVAFSGSAICNLGARLQQFMPIIFGGHEAAATVQKATQLIQFQNYCYLVRLLPIKNTTQII
jgi:hypothetical protein